MMLIEKISATMKGMSVLDVRISGSGGENLEIYFEEGFVLTISGEESNIVRQGLECEVNTWDLLAMKEPGESVLKFNTREIE